MYIDDQTALDIARLYELREMIKEAQTEADTLRHSIESVMDESGVDVLTTDDFSVLMNKRTTIRVNRSRLEELAPDVAREVTILGNSNVIHIAPRS